MSGISNDCCLPTCSTTMRTGLILDWRRTRQQVVQQKFALRVKARLNPFRDWAGCTIAMRWQRRLRGNSSEDKNSSYCNPPGAQLTFSASILPRSTISLRSQTEELLPSRKKSFSCRTKRFGDPQAETAAIYRKERCKRDQAVRAGRNQPRYESAPRIHASGRLRRAGRHSRLGADGVSHILASARECLTRCQLPAISQSLARVFCSWGAVRSQ